MKTCTKCSQEKAITEFYKDKRNSDGRRSHCKECFKFMRDKHYQDNKEIIKKKYHENKERYKENFYQYHLKNKKKINAKARKYYIDNKDNIREQKKQYREDNRDKIREYYKKRRANDPFFKFKEGVRGAIKTAFRNQGYSKNSKTFEILGCSFEHLMNWLDFEKWNNEDCHIDHIIPVSLAKNEDEVLLLNHYTNLQILSAEDNLKKGNRHVKFENLIKVVNNHPEPTKITKILNNSNINLL